MPFSVSTCLQRDGEIFADCVKYKIVAFTAFAKILLRVIDDPVSTQGFYRFNISGTDYAGHVRAEMLGKLHRIAAYAPQCAIDQYCCPRSILGFFACPLEMVYSKFLTE